MNTQKSNYRIVMLGSGVGTTIDYFCTELPTKDLKTSVVAVISDRKNSGVERVAKKHSIPFQLIEYKKAEQNEWNEKLLEVVTSYKPNLILLAGFLRKIPPSFLSHFPRSVINSHPSLLPDFSGKGMYGSLVHEAVIKAKKNQTGVSIHIVDEDWDKGSLLGQKTLAVFSGETALELEKRVKKIEKEFYLHIVFKIISKEIKLNEF